MLVHKLNYVQHKYGSPYNSRVINFLMNKKTFVLGMLCSISMLGFAQQQTDSTKVEQLEEVVITDSRFKLKRENSGKVITKITQSELQKLQGKSVAEIINATAGIEINGTKSNAGQSLSYFIRGGRNRQVLVLIDGIAITDASQIANDYDLRLLNTDQIESIEILKGASSTLYGSGAANAVINIKLKDASKRSVSVNFKSVLGTNQSSNTHNYAVQDFRNSVSVNGTLNKFNYLASFGNQYTNGLSALSSGTESDAFNVINGNLKLGYQFSEALKTTVYGSFDTYKTQFDDAFSGIDSDDKSTSKQYRIGISPQFTYKNGSITLNAVYNTIERDIASSYPAKFSAESYVAGLFNRYNFNDTFYTVLGLNAQENTMESFSVPFGSSSLVQSINPNNAQFTSVDPYVNVVFASNFGLALNTGLRLNNHNTYGSQVVYSVNPSFKKETNFGYVKGLASYSTAYITPSLYQLFEPTYGNANLKPEENATIEVGVEINLKDKANASVVFFTRTETNFIDFVDLGNWMYQYNNVENSFIANGIEFTGNYKFTKALTLNANATYTNVEDALSLRIPKFKANAKIDYQLCESTFMSLSYQFNDKRTDAVYNDVTFVNDEITLKSYSLLDFYISRKMLYNKMTLFANITNILNADYAELFGYSTKGRNINIGFNLNL